MMTRIVHTSPATPPPARGAAGHAMKPAPPRPPQAPGAAEALDLDALRALEPRALERLVRRQEERLYWIMYRFVRDPDEARSLVQETFLQAFRSLPTFHGRAKLSTWLYSIARNVASSHLRKARRLRVVREEDFDYLQPVRAAQGGRAAHEAPGSPEAVLERRERARLVHAALDRLPEAYRAVVVKRDLEELSTAEAAEALAISEENVRVRLFRARRALHKMLAPHLGQS